MPRHDPVPPPVVPPGLAAAWGGDEWRAWIEALPGLALAFLDRWQLRPDGPPAHGVIAMVLPVVGADGSPAALKLQRVDEETRGEPSALRTWDGRGAVRLLDSDPESGTMLLERLDAGRSLETEPDELTALGTLAGLLEQLSGYPAPAGLPRLADRGAAMLDRVPQVLSRLADAADRRLTADCAAALREVLDRPGDRLLHWDLHYGNVLAAPPEAQRAGRAPSPPATWPPPSAAASTCSRRPSAWTGRAHGAGRWPGRCSERSGRSSPARPPSRPGTGPSPLPCGPVADRPLIGRGTTGR